MDNLDELKVLLILKYGHLSNGELYFLLRTDSEFRKKYHKCDERLQKWYLRDNGRIWRDDELSTELSTICKK